MNGPFLNQGTNAAILKTNVLQTNHGYHCKRYYFKIFHLKMEHSENKEEYPIVKRFDLDADTYDDVLEYLRNRLLQLLAAGKKYCKQL